MLRLLLSTILCCVVLPCSLAQTPPELGATVRLTHIAADKWRADYKLAAPVESIVLEPTGTAYRSSAWRMLTPGLVLAREGEDDVVAGGGKPFSAFSVEVGRYDVYGPAHYTPMDRFSDGGTDVYTGFFAGEAKREGKAHALVLTLDVAGLPGETVLAPASGKSEIALGYAYFGPTKPVPAGIANVILDPGTPAWAAETMRTTTEKISKYYEQAFQRKLNYQPLVMVSAPRSDVKGMSYKGGAVGRQVVYRLEGKKLEQDSPANRGMIAWLVSHELAHVWQMDVNRGGIDGKEPWVHEGGAEALALAALAGSGALTQGDADAFAARLVAECDTLKGELTTYRGAYACGFKRYRDTGVDVFALWRAMVAETQASGTPYSSAMMAAQAGKLPKEAGKTGSP